MELTAPIQAWRLLPSALHAVVGSTVTSTMGLPPVDHVMLATTVLKVLTLQPLMSTPLVSLDPALLEVTAQLRLPLRYHVQLERTAM